MKTKSIDFPFNRFYMNENKANNAEIAYANLQSTQNYLRISRNKKRRSRHKRCINR